MISRNSRSRMLAPQNGTMIVGARSFTFCSVRIVMTSTEQECSTSTTEYRPFNCIFRSSIELITNLKMRNQHAYVIMPFSSMRRNWKTSKVYSNLHIGQMIGVSFIQNPLKLNECKLNQFLIILNLNFGKLLSFILKPLLLNFYKHNLRSTYWINQFLLYTISRLNMKRDHPESDEENHEQVHQAKDNKQVKIERVMPKKAQYRMRAHINPLNSTPFPYPPHHSFVDWKSHYPAFYQNTTKQQNLKVYANTVQHPSFYDTKRTYELTKNVTMIDIGCGFGGLLFGLSPLFPDNLILGMEIRDKLVNYVGQKIKGHRITYPGGYNNISVVRTNTMRHLCQYFSKGSLQKIFICFPDPHFKAKNYRRRIVNTGYLSEYAYLLKPGAKLYCITDVLELHEWHIQHLRAHKMFTQLKDENDPCIQVMVNKTQEGQKVERNQGSKYWAIFQRVKDE